MRTRSSIACAAIVSALCGSTALKQRCRPGGAGRQRDVPDSDFLDELLTLEIRSKAEKHLAMRVSLARFAFQKTLEAFGVKFQPSIDPNLIRELATGRY